MSMPQFSVTLFKEQSKRLNYSSICRPTSTKVADRQYTIGNQEGETQSFNEPNEKQHPWDWTTHQRSEQPVLSDCRGDTGYEDDTERHQYHHLTRASESPEIEFDRHDLEFVLADSDETAGRKQRQALKDHMLELV